MIIANTGKWGYTFPPISEYGVICKFGKFLREFCSSADVLDDAQEMISVQITEEKHQVI